MGSIRFGNMSFGYTNEHFFFLLSQVNSKEYFLTKINFLFTFLIIVRSRDDPLKVTRNDRADGFLTAETIQRRNLVPFQRF